MTDDGAGWSPWRGRIDPDEYDHRWREMAEAGQNPHGEADLVSSFHPATVLDAGCGTGRVAIELARRGIQVVGTDVDDDMLAVARRHAPDLEWITADLAALALEPQFDLVVLAGNVIPFVAPPSRAAAVAACARALLPAGRLVAGFQRRDGWPEVDDYDHWCADAGLELEDRWSTWDRAPYVAGGPYAVSVHRRRSTPNTS